MDESATVKSCQMILNCWYESAKCKRIPNSLAETYSDLLKMMVVIKLNNLYFVPDSDEPMDSGAFSN